MWWKHNELFQKDKSQSPRWSGDINEMKQLILSPSRISQNILLIYWFSLIPNQYMNWSRLFLATTNEVKLASELNIATYLYFIVFSFSNPFDVVISFSNDRKLTVTERWCDNHAITEPFRIMKLQNWNWDVSGNCRAVEYRAGNLLVGVGWQLISNTWMFCSDQ